MQYQFEFLRYYFELFVAQVRYESDRYSGVKNFRTVADGNILH